MSLLDFPGVIAAIAFTPGCNFRCGYCHNPEFVLPERLAQLRPSFIKEDSFFRFLESRKGLLEGVVVTGGEPTLMPDLLEFLGKIKERGFKTKLDTNGNRFEVLKKAVEGGLVDYVAMDVKTSLEAYPELVGQLASREDLRQSIDFLKEGRVPYEFRSTILRETHPREILEEMVKLVSGAERFSLQTFRPANTLSPEYAEFHAYEPDEMGEILELFRPHVKEVILR